MRLIDADAEIAKIEQEIERTKAWIKEWEDNREDRGGYYNVDTEIKQLKSNITQARVEIACLKGYSTAYDVDKVVEQLKRNSSPFMGDPDDRDVDLRMAIRIVKAGEVNE